MKSTHSIFAWIALVAILIACLLAVFSLMSSKSLSPLQLKIALFAMISAHFQLLVGLVLYFISPFGIANLSSETMKDSFARLQAVEHPIVNILAILMITIGYRKVKKMSGTLKASNSILIYYGIGLVLLLSRIPWKSWMS